MKARYIDPQIVKELFYYNKETGDLIRKKTNEVAGHVSRTGYVVIKIGRTAHKAHRLAYVIMTGEQPDIIDHINQNKSDNRWVNLRSVSKRINCCNHSRKPASTGYRGVHINKYGRYVVQLGLTLNGVRKYRYFGVYEDLELAVLVADAVVDKYHEVPKCQ